MKQNIVKVTCHGSLGEALGRKEWFVGTNNFPSAMSAVETLSKRKFCKHLIESEQRGIKYRILINGRDFLYDEKNPPNPNNFESIRNSELWSKNKNLRTIDIIPILEGSGELIVYIIISVVIAVIVAVIQNALIPDIELQSYKAREKTSYLFNGPVNTISEGIPVPVGYGRLLIGSAVISASYDPSEFLADDQTEIPGSITDQSSGREHGHVDRGF